MMHWIRSASYEHDHDQTLMVDDMQVGFVWLTVYDQWRGSVYSKMYPGGTKEAHDAPRIICATEQEAKDAVVAELVRLRMEYPK